MRASARKGIAYLQMSRKLELVYFFIKQIIYVTVAIK